MKPSEAGLVRLAMNRLVCALLLLACGLALAEPVLDRAFEPAGFFRPYPGRAGRQQSYESFLKRRHNTPTDQRHTIVLVPLGDLPRNLDLSRVQTFLQAFFQVPVRVAPRQAVTTSKAGSKYSADAIQRSLLAALPADALSILALTDVDLYAEDVGPNRLLFGQGHYYNRSAVASLNRLSSKRDELQYHRAFKLAAHELTHTFGLRHCTHYRCLLNSSGSVAQSDARPLELCPDCLRKLHAVLGFDPVKRCRDLNQATRVALPEDHQWYQARLSYLTAP